MNKKLVLLLGTMVFVAAIGAILISIVNGNATKTKRTDNETINIVTTFYPIYLIGMNLTDGIEGIELKSLTDMNTGCLHDYQLTTEDMKAISNADILITNGGGMETFLEDVINNYPELKIIESSKNVPLLKNDADSNKVLYVKHNHGDNEEYNDELTDEDGEVHNDDEQNHEVGETRAEDHLISEYNSHIWLNPSNYLLQIENVKVELLNFITQDEALQSDEADRIKNEIEQNARIYMQLIEDFNSHLDTELAASLSNLDTTNVLQAVIFHDAFAYIADRIGIQVAFTVPLEVDSALSAGDIATIIDVVKEKNIKLLFIEQQFSNSIAKQIEAETDAKMYIIDSVVTGEGSKDSYLKAMQKNLEVLKEALNWQNIGK